LGNIKTWEGKWFGEKGFARNLHEDLKIRKYIEGKWKHAAISFIEVERAAQRLTVNIYTARPGIIIGRRGSEVDKLKSGLQKLTNKQAYINIQEIKRAELEARLVAENVALQLEKRINFRRAMRQAVSLTMRMGAKGIKISCAGRLGGREMARREWYKEGRIPLHTLRADIDYGFTEARTTYGKIGVKVWIFRGEILGKKSAPGTLSPGKQKSA
jgi:small subunit ribosomal protein S3